MNNYTIEKIEKALGEIPNTKFSITEKKDILKAVEKGIKKPLYFKKQIGKFHSLWICPNCKKTKYTTGAENTYPLRCSHCGQRLCWKEFKAQEQRERKLIANMLMKY